MRILVSPFYSSFYNTHCSSPNRGEDELCKHVPFISPNTDLLVNQLEFEAQLASHVSHIRVKKMNKGCKHNKLVLDTCPFVWLRCADIKIRFTLGWRDYLFSFKGLCWIFYPEEINYVVYIPLTCVTIRHPPL